MHDLRLALAPLALFAAACASPRPAPSAAPEPDPDSQEAAAPAWMPLFDGQSLDGWVVKIAGRPLGDDPAHTFRVEDGLLSVRYDGYERFDGRFGHLFFEAPFARYRLRVEYRFVGEQAPGGPGWALRNSGAMLHCQSPESMGLEQDFPVSIEAQTLGGGGSGERPTGNLCTPGTHVVMGGELVRRHCTSSSSDTFHGDQWVMLEVEVLGHERIRHFVNGALVLEYGEPQLDADDADARRLLEAGAPLELGSGWIALQAESHPLDFRRVELLVLDE